MTRRPWDQYFLELAHQVASRSTCDRAHVGAVLVLDKNILSTGYNGSIRGLDHCDDVGHLMEDNHCVRTVHAEANAIASAARHGVSVKNAVLYVTHFPCWLCFKLIANAGISKVVYDTAYRLDEKVLDAAQKSGIELLKIRP